MKHFAFSQSVSCSVVSDFLCLSSWTVAYQVPLSMKFFEQEYWSGLPFPSPGDLPDPGIKPGSPVLQADSLPFEPPGKVAFTKAPALSLGFWSAQGLLYLDGEWLPSCLHSQGPLAPVQP